MSHVELNADQLDHLAATVARRVIDHLAATQRQGDAGEFLTAAQVAARLGVSRDSVYSNADRLGAVRLGRSSREPSPDCALTSIAS